MTDPTDELREACGQWVHPSDEPFFTAFMDFVRAREKAAAVEAYEKAALVVQGCGPKNAASPRPDCPCVTCTVKRAEAREREALEKAEQAGVQCEAVSRDYIACQEREREALAEVERLKAIIAALKERLEETEGARHVLHQTLVALRDENRVLTERAVRFRDMAEMVDRVFRRDDFEAMQLFGTNLPAHIAREALLAAEQPAKSEPCRRDHGGGSASANCPDCFKPAEP